jgi:putative colanic acid biosysnthesis UDP-glucose lipid carrier transferase
VISVASPAITVGAQAPSHLAGLVPGGVLRRYGQDLAQIQRWVDMLGVSLLLWAVSGCTAAPWGRLEQTIALIAALMVALVAPRLGLYESFRASSHWSLMRRLSLLWLVLVGGVSLGLFLFKVGALVSREQLLLWFSAVGVYLAISHLVSRQLLRLMRVHGRNSRCDGYIGSREGLQRLHEEMESAVWLGHTVRAVLCWPQGLLPEEQQLSALRQQIRSGPLPDQWLVEEPPNSQLLNHLLECLQDQPAPVLLLPHWLQHTGCQPRFCQLGRLPALELWGGSEAATPLQLNIKYLFDKLASAFILLWWSPLLLTITLAVKLDSPGPVLFRQRRYGLNGQPFDCLKFRTMFTQDNGAVVVQARRHDPRVTRVGAFLRRWNLDELPQLINVWRGEMSLVGPRPHAEAHNELYRTKVAGYMRRHGLRPGLTGWAQVLGLRGETDTLEKMQARVQADLDYIENWSLWLDLKIFLLTFLRWRSCNAY